MATKLSRALLGESASAGRDLAISSMSASILSWRRSASACSRARTSSDNSRVTVMRQAYGQRTRPGSASVRPTPAAPRPQEAGRVSQPSRSLDGLDGDVDSCLGGELTGDGGLLTGLVRQVLQTGLEVEMAEHMGYERQDPSGRGTSNSPRSRLLGKLALLLEVVPASDDAVAASEVGAASVRGMVVAAVLAAGARRGLRAVRSCRLI